MPAGPGWRFGKIAAVGKLYDEVAGGFGEAARVAANVVVVTPHAHGGASPYQESETRPTKR